MLIPVSRILSVKERKGPDMKKLSLVQAVDLCLGVGDLRRQVTNTNPNMAQ